METQEVKTSMLGVLKGNEMRGVWGQVGGPGGLHVPLKQHTSYIQVICVVSPFIPHIFIDNTYQALCFCDRISSPGWSAPQVPVEMCPAALLPGCLPLLSPVDALPTLSHAVLPPRPTWSAPQISTLLAPNGFRAVSSQWDAAALGAVPCTLHVPLWSLPLCVDPPKVGALCTEALEGQQNKVDMLVARNFKRLFQQVVLSSLKYIQSQARSYSQSVSLYCFQENQKVYQSMYGQM